MVWENLATRKPEQYYQRLRVVAVFIGIGVALLAGRLVWLQVVKGEYYREQALNNSIRIVPKRAPRGLVYDRRLRPLVDNAPSLTLAVIPAELRRRSEEEQAAVWKRLSRLLNKKPEELLERYTKHLPRPFAPVRLKGDIDRKLVSEIEERHEQLPGVVILSDSKRSYPRATGSHVLGYVSEITDRQLAPMKKKGYRIGDMIGQTGVERVYDKLLRGTDGGRQVRIDSAGRELGLLHEIPTRQGNNLVLAIDRDLQMVAEQALGRHAGAIVAMDPRNGEVLALVSKPDYSLEDFASGISAKAWRKLLKDKRHPMSNRVTQGLYPPGSIFKIVTAAAALKAGLTDPREPRECLGIHWISTWPYRCWREIGHGYIGMHRSIVESCDIYFYQVGQKIKVNRLEQAALDFGYGRKTGIDLPEESQGLVPSAQWKEKTQHMPWFPGNTVMMSIGQGYLLSTPLQLATMTAAVANGGIVYKPRLLKKVTDPNGELVEEIDAMPLRQVDLDAGDFHFIREAMKGAVMARKGTGWRARVAGMNIGGKTGTAQNPHGEDHAAFVAFAPVDQPRIVISVLVENGGEGGLTAAPMAQQILQAYFER